MIFNQGGGGVTVGSWRFTTAPAMPASIAKNSMVAIVAATPATIYVADSEPAAPANGDVWFHVFNQEDGLVMSDGSVPVKCWGAYRYDGTEGEWALLPAYYAFLGAWWELPGLPPVGTALNDCSWAQIDRIGRAGKGADYFTVGEAKDVTLSTSETIQLRLVGMNHDQLADGSGAFAPFSFHMVNCLQDAGQMEGSGINTRGWHGCAMRNTCNTTYYGMLPDDLKAVVKEVAKKASAGNRSATIITSFDKVWLAAEIEIFGVIASSKPGEGSQYAFYTNSAMRIKQRAGTASNWWERSPSANDATSFMYVSPSGAVGGYNANASYSVALGLCV